jgi:pre-rRNA-processing protein TSR4
MSPSLPLSSKTPIPFKAFSSSLPRVNPIWSEDVSDDETDNQKVDPSRSMSSTSTSKSCVVCGFLGNLQCASCKTARYCSKAHQSLDWTHGAHARLCGRPDFAKKKSASSHRSIAFAFAGSELVTEDEPSKMRESTYTKDLVASLDESVSLPREIGANVGVDLDLDGNEEETVVDVDKAFLKFQKRMLREPEQVVRYR